MIKKRIIFFLICLMASLSAANAQSSKIDSLRFIIKFNADNNKKVKAYLSLSQELLFKDFDECQTNLKAGTALAETLKDSGLLSEFTKFTGLSWYFKGSYDSAAVYYYKTLDILKAHPDAGKKAGLLNELGKLYRKTKDLDRALQMYDEAFSLYKSINDDGGMATILNESGVVFEYKEDYDEAISRYKRSLAIREKMNDTVGKSYSLNFIGGVYTIQKKYAEAEKYLLQSLDLRQQIKDSFAIALNYGDLAFMYKEQGLYAKAIKNYSLSNAMAEKMQFADLQLSNYKELADIAEKTGDYASSLGYYKKQTALKDSIYSGDKMKQIEQLNAKYQTEKKEQQLQLQRSEITRKNYLLWGPVGGVLLLIIFGFSFYRKC